MEPNEVEVDTQKDQESSKEEGSANSTTATTVTEEKRNERKSYSKDKNLDDVKGELFKKEELVEINDSSDDTSDDSEDDDLFREPKGAKKPNTQGTQDKIGKDTAHGNELTEEQGEAEAEQEQL